MTISHGTARVAAALAAVGFGLFSLFQIALALGAPLGAAAWGGQYRTLPANLRIASVASALVFVTAALIALGRAGYWGRERQGLTSVFRWGTWAIGALLALDALPNLASSSPWERYLLAPAALLLAVLCLIVALGSRQRER
jgi:hypothetical protein